MGVDWQQVYMQKYPPPLIPPRGEVNAADALDIGSFDEEDTKGYKVLSILLSRLRPKLLPFFLLFHIRLQVWSIYHFVKYSFCFYLSFVCCSNLNVYTFNMCGYLFFNSWRKRIKNCIKTSHWSFRSAGNPKCLKRYSTRLTRKQTKLNQRRSPSIGNTTLTRKVQHCFCFLYISQVCCCKTLWTLDRC